MEFLYNKLQLSGIAYPWLHDIPDYTKKSDNLNIKMPNY